MVAMTTRATAAPLTTGTHHGDVAIIAVIILSFPINYLYLPVLLSSDWLFPPPPVFLGSHPEQQITTAIIATKKSVNFFIIPST